MKEKNKARLTLRILCCVLAGLMILSVASYLVYAFVGLM